MTEEKENDYTDLVSQAETVVMDQPEPVDIISDEEFIKRFKQTIPETSLSLLMTLGEICNAKAQFSDEKQTLKQAGCTKSKYSKLSSVGRSKRIFDLADRQLLPAKSGLSLLYAITLLTDAQFIDGIERNVINPSMTRRTVEALSRGEVYAAEKTKRATTANPVATIIASKNLTASERLQIREELLSLCKERGLELVE